MKKEILFVIGLLVLSSGFALTVNLYDTNGNPYNQFYYDPSVGVYTGTIVVEVCNTTAPTGYVTLLYGDQGDYIAVAKSLTTGEGILKPLGSSYTNAAGEYCANATVALINTPPSVTTEGPWTYPAWPAYLWAVISADNVTDANDIYIPLKTDANLVGSYSVSVGNFNYTTGYINVTVNGARVYTSSTTSLYLTQPVSSINGSDQVVYGVCNDAYGTNCISVQNSTFESISGKVVSLNTGHAGINDSQSYLLYFVINGKGYPIKLGANLQGTISTPSQVYWGEKVPVTVTIKNTGNVPVTSNFTVELIYNESGNTVTYSKTVTGGVPVGGDVNLTFNEPWKFPSVGNGNITVIIDSSNVINETDETDNVATKAVTLLPSYNVSVKVNGNAFTSFPYAGVPYDVNLTVYQQPGNVPVNAAVELIEENGLAFITPNTSAKTKIISYLNVPASGLVFTLVPTKHTTNYSLYLYGLKFYNGTDVTDKITLNVSSSSFEENSLSGISSATYISNFVTLIGKIYYYMFKALV